MRSLTMVLLFTWAALAKAADATTTDTASQSVHPDVANALAYSMPANSCERPEMDRRGKNDDTRNAKYERQYRRYIRCLQDHQEVLFSDFQQLQEAVKHGVTPAQAETIKGHLTTLATTIKSLQDGGELGAPDRAEQIKEAMAAPPVSIYGNSGGP